MLEHHSRGDRSSRAVTLAVPYVGGNVTFVVMTRLQKVLERVLRGTADAAIPFEDLRRLLLALGFQERIRGSHHIYTREGVAEILNLQPKGKQAKPYQVRQVRHVIVTYKLGEIGDGED